MPVLAMFSPGYTYSLLTRPLPEWPTHWRDIRQHGKVRPPTKVQHNT